MEDLSQNLGDLSLRSRSNSSRRSSRSNLKESQIVEIIVMQSHIRGFLSRNLTCSSL